MKNSLIIIACILTLLDTHIFAGGLSGDILIEIYPESNQETRGLKKLRDLKKSDIVFTCTESTNCFYSRVKALTSYVGQSFKARTSSETDFEMIFSNGIQVFSDNTWKNATNFRARNHLNSPFDFGFKSFQPKPHTLHSSRTNGPTALYSLILEIDEEVRKNIKPDEQLSVVAALSKDFSFNVRGLSTYELSPFVSYCSACVRGERSICTPQIQHTIESLNSQHTWNDTTKSTEISKWSIAHCDDLREDLDNLIEFNLKGSNIVDLKPIEEFDALESLILSNNSIRDVTSLVNLPNLREIDIVLS